MAWFQVDCGKRYRARITLGFFERMAGNETIAGKLENAGFTRVQVVGDGAERWAFGTWAGPSQRVELPGQVDASSITEIP